ncbi:hypothetical protein GCM10018793_34020 [Streptomyces sulfonofaciens]|uniref:Cellulose-binding protein n=1 Tax=Streptomyces sulfonofaciens TaxID=68272 RepID=A0A919L236_9ACTN|nr:cellulose-binding protein [Streptomyces sulfonofaciens]GHH79991.1 hypothetical protein GCM10018793_34020 [Streptomyces sulfonofaciens]
MSTASASPHGFAAVRGRGYRPGQVDVCVRGLSRERDEAWERAARLTVMAKEMEAELARLDSAAARLAPQTYETLGVRARQLLALTQEEASAVRAGAEEEARRIRETAVRAARETRDAARAYAEALRSEADEYARRRLLADRGTADELRTAARTEAKEARRAALMALREMRQRAAALLADQEGEHKERGEAAERQFAEREAELTVHGAELTAQAEARLREAQRALAQAGETARREQESAEACGAELLAEARMRVERIGRETDRALREHDAQRDEVRVHMDRVRNSLLALTGRTDPPADGS